MKPSMRRFFVTGTDTGAGKTFVTAAIARRATAQGQKVFAFKPIETGCELVDNRLTGPDQEIVCAAAGGWQTGEQRGVYQLVHPLAPLVAARAENVQIDLDRVVGVANSVPDVNLLIVEGAGGWRVPITESDDMSSLAKRLDAKVVIAARAGLGTINHSLLTIEAVERDGMEIAAVVLSRRPGEELEFARSNRDEIRRCWNGTVVLFDTDSAVFDELVD
ncbi:MAG TPA: dethiobiotin synthase [Kofleriaceae bacterium]